MIKSQQNINGGKVPANVAHATVKVHLQQAKLSREDNFTG